MKYYVEINIIKDEYYNNIMSSLFQQLHLFIVESKSNIAVSFKDYYCDDEDDRISVLGDTVLLFAKTAEELNKLNLIDKFRFLLNKNEIFISDVKTVPEKIEGYAIFSKVDVKYAQGATKRRWERRNPGKSFVYKEENKSNLPFIRLKSLSSGNFFSLHIKKTIVDEAVEGRFSTYGLSSSSTVPLF